MNRYKTCCFTGHRPKGLGYPENSPQCEKLKGKIRDILVRLIERENVTAFISGMALGVDLYAAETVCELKSEYPGITLECALPCPEQSRNWKNGEKARYAAVIAAADKTTLLRPVYSKGCMQQRNRYMVDGSDLVFAVWNGNPGGTAMTVRYARSKNKPILLLDPNTLECRREQQISFFV